MINDADQWDYRKDDFTRFYDLWTRKDEVPQWEILENLDTLEGILENS